MPNKQYQQYLTQDEKYQAILKEKKAFEQNLLDYKKKQVDFHQSLIEQIQLYINTPHQTAIAQFLKRYEHVLKNQDNWLPSFDEIPNNLPEDFRCMLISWNQTAPTLHTQLARNEDIHSELGAYERYYTAIVAFENKLSIENNSLVRKAANEVYDAVKQTKIKLEGDPRDAKELFRHTQLDNLAEGVERTTSLLAYYKVMNLSNEQCFIDNYLYYAERQKGGRERYLPHDLILATIIVSSVLGTIGPIMIGISFLFLSQVHQALFIVGIIFTATVIALALYDLIWSAVWGPLKPLTDLAAKMNNFANKVKELFAGENYEYELEKMNEYKYRQGTVFVEPLDRFLGCANNIVNTGEHTLKENMIKIFQDIKEMLSSDNERAIDRVLNTYHLNPRYTCWFLKREIDPKTQALYQAIHALGALKKTQLARSYINDFVSQTATVP